MMAMIINSLFRDPPRLPLEIDVSARVVLTTVASYLVMAIMLTGFDTSPRMQKLLDLQPDSPALLGFIAPDSHWLSFVGSTTDGSLARPKPTQLLSTTERLPSDNYSSSTHVRMFRRDFVEAPQAVLYEAQN